MNTSADDDPDGTNMDSCTLREAIIAVNSASKAFGGCDIKDDTIAFDDSLRGQTITITNSAFPRIISNVTIQGLGEEQLTVSGDNQFRVFEIRRGAEDTEVTIRDLTITKGLATNGDGGGILSTSSGMLTIEDVTVSNSTATGSGSIETGRGGGISAQTLTVTNSTLSGNSATGSGGGIVASTATVSNSTLSGNSVGGFGSSGGGIYADTATVSNSTLSSNSAAFRGGGISASRATVSNSTLSGNSAAFGGGGGIFASTATVSNSTLSGNSAVGGGGGINGFSRATVSNSTLSGNSAIDGGGIYSRTATVTVSNSTLSGNSAREDGGGIYSRTATVSNSTIVLNRSTTGGGILRSGTGSFVVNNTIVAGNTNATETTPNEISGTLSGGFNNLIGDTASDGGLTNGVDGNIVGPVNINTVLDTTLAANGTTILAGDPNAPGGQQPVLTHALVSGSPAINRGNNDLVITDPTTGMTTDQRGLPRIVGGTVDIGAFEVQ